MSDILDELKAQIPINMSERAIAMSINEKSVPLLLIRNAINEIERLSTQRNDLVVLLEERRYEIDILRTKVEMLERHKAETMAMLDNVLNGWRSSNDEMTKVLHD